MNKKASNIVKDALNLANLSNTNFCTHKELRDYINDGFTSIYNELIDKGNQYWLKEAFAERNSDGYWLPSDFYRAYNVKASTGSIVPRATRSASGYSIRNNQLFMENYYGLVKLEYYPKPTYISFPASTIELDKNIISVDADNTHTWGPYVLTPDRTVINIETKEVFDLTALDNQPYLIGDGWVVYQNQHGDKVLSDFSGNELNSIQGSGYFIPGTSGRPYGYWYDNDDDISNIWPALIDAEGPIMSFKGRNQNIIEVADRDENITGCWWLEVEDGDKVAAFHFLDTEGNDYSVEPSVMKYLGNPKWNYCPDWSDDTLLFTTGNNVALLTPNVETGYLDIVEYKVDGVANGGLVEYNENSYFLTTDLMGPKLIGYEPDTLMEYPTNVFYRALAAYIAIQLLSKQSADTTNMQASFQSLVATLNQSKDSSADYPTIAVYY